LQHEHTPQLALRLNSNENDGAPNGKRGMKYIREEHHLNIGDESKITIKACVQINVLLEILPNHHKRTFVIES
jgi:hypothetical protein